MGCDGVDALIGSLGKLSDKSDMRSSLLLS